MSHASPVSLAQAQGSSRRCPFAASTALAVLTLLAFGTTLANGFVWIDHWQIESGGLIAHSWMELAQAWRQPLGSQHGWQETAPYARPTVIAVLSVVNLVAGASAPAYHALCIGLHVANTLLIYSLLSALGVGPAVAWLASAVFGLHPVQTAAVSWISGIADPLCTVFLLLAWRLEVGGGCGRRRVVASAVALLSFVLALGAKETAAVLPALVAVRHVLGVGAPWASRRDRLIAVICSASPFLVALIPMYLGRRLVLSGAALGLQTPVFSSGTRLQTLPRLLADYILLPFRFTALTVCDDYRLSLSWDNDTVLALAALLALATSTWLLRRRLPHVLFAAVCMVVCLLPALNLFPILHYRADRFMYLPMFGWSLAVVAMAEGMLAFLPAWSRRRMGVALAVALVTVVVALTLRRNRLFHDDVTLFEQVVQVSPHCREAHATLGDAYLRAGRAGDAASEYARALVVEADRASYVVLPKVFINLGFARMAQHQYREAIAAFTQAHSLEPQLANPVFGLGVAHLALGELPDGIRWLEQADGLQPNDPDVTLDLGRAYDQVGRFAEAMERYRQYLSIAPQGRAHEEIARRLQQMSSGSQRS
jgi:tetratricopeptide (TPR) repeat protein